ncbi:MAG: FAD-dependent oxidoreductase, partial [bacterium]|nr:FAD-dependent oxidoreductase [bacterium]
MAAPWFKSTPDSRRYPRLQGARKSDVVVVGAGIAGCMTAYRLAKNGVQVTLIEANHVATGDTGYTTAFVTRIPDTALAPLVTRYGERFMERLIAFNKQTQRSIRDLVLQQKIKCDWQECRSFIVSYHKEDPDLAGEWSVLHQVEPLAHKATRQELNQSAPQATDGIVIEQEAHFDPRKFLIGLLQTPIGKKITIFEESAVTNVTATTKSVHVTTDLGAITANKVVIATGLPIMDEFKPLFTTHITYALLAHYKQQPVSDDLVWDTDLPYFYYRRYIDRIMLGGADSKPGFESAIAQQKLDSFLAKRLPGDYAVTERWSGSLFASQDGLPYADQHPHHPGRIWVISGLAGNGMVMGSAAATLVADSITDTHNGA